jgi:hypothetical protein
MRRGLLVTALLLPLAGCVVPPDGGYVTSYPGPEVYPGYYYNDGAPYIIVEGQPAPLIYYGGTWGYYDRYHHFQHAPDQVWRHLEERNPHGAGLRPWDGPHHPPGGAYGGQPGYHPPPPGGYQGGGYQPRPGGQPPGQPPMGEPHGQFQGRPPGQPMGQPPGQPPGQPHGQPMGQQRPPAQPQGQRPAPPRQDDRHGEGNH